MGDSPDHAFEPDLAGAFDEEDARRAVFDPVPVRYRHDGWVPDRQLAFIEALAGCGCVDEAAKSVGKSRASAYALRRRHDAQAFRLAGIRDDAGTVSHNVVRPHRAAAAIAPGSVAEKIFTPACR